MRMEQKAVPSLRRRICLRWSRDADEGSHASRLQQPVGQRGYPAECPVAETKDSPAAPGLSCSRSRQRIQAQVTEGLQDVQTHKTYRTFSLRR